MSDAEATPSFDVAVLGAGPAGLAAALRLARDGRSVVVLERAEVPGGLAGSFEVAGMPVDHGAHRLDPACDPHVLAVLQGLLGDDLRLRAHHDRARVAGRWVDFPVRTRSGPGSIEGPYAEKLWGLAPDRLDLDLDRTWFGAGPRGQRPTPRRIGRGRTGNEGYVARRGYGQIGEVLAAAAATAGAELRFGADVHRLRADAQGIDVTASDGHRVRVGLVASSLPVPVLARVCAEVVHGGGGDVPPAVRDAAATLEFRAVVLVYLVLDQPRYGEWDVSVFPGADVAALRVSEPTRVHRDWGADGPTVLCAEIPCSVGDPVWSASDADLGARVAADLRRSALPAVTPVEVVVRRLPRAFPVPSAGSAARLGVIHGWLDEQPRIVSFGRQGSYSLDDAHQALAAGWALGDQ